MTARTEHASTITPELAALAELVFMVELLRDEGGIQRTPRNGPTHAAFLVALAQSKLLVAERIMTPLRRDAERRADPMQLDL